MRTEELTIGGMSCGHCVAALRKELEKVEGLDVQEVTVGRARVRYDEGRVSAGRIAGAVHAAGYAIVVVRAEGAE
jgi:copper chaperone